MMLMQRTRTPRDCPFQEPVAALQRDFPEADEVGGSCSTGIECVKLQLSSTARKGAAQ